MITLRRMSLFDCWRAIEWRNACRAYLRTPTDDTRWTQFKFYVRVILNPWSRHSYRAVYRDGQMVGMVGLCNIVPGVQGEISLITRPEMRGRGVGREAVRLMWNEAERLGLPVVWGEVYCHNPASTFWYRLVTERLGKWTRIDTTRDGQTVSAYRFEVRV